MQTQPPRQEALGNSKKTRSPLTNKTKKEIEELAIIQVGVLVFVGNISASLVDRKFYSKFLGEKSINTLVRMDWIGG